jgi:type IV secretory pathway component VirB8
MGGSRGSRAERRRKLVAMVIVFGMILATAATVISLMLG